MGRKGRSGESSGQSPQTSFEDSIITVTVESRAATVTDDPRVTTLLAENERLKQRLEEAERRLAEAREVNVELSRAKELLSEEIVELTKVLFEEANGMVAEETRARSQLESAKRKLQAELHQIQDRLRLESQQLQELKQKLYAHTSNTSVATGQSIEMASPTREPRLVALDPENLSYFDLLFPDRRFSSRNKCHGPNGGAWKAIVGSIDLTLFDSFTKFLDIVGRLSEESFLGSPFVKRIYEMDIGPCLAFDCKANSFPKSLVRHFLRNECSIEKVNACSLLGSPIQRTLSAASQTASRYTTSAQPNLVDALSPDDLASPVEPQSRLMAMVSEFTHSLTSIADPAYSPDGQLKRPQPTFCALCGSRLDACLDSSLYRFKISEKDPPLLIDAACREKLVAVAELFTFLRHLRKGLFSSRPIVDLYFEVLHYRRNMFYARTGSLAFFGQSDLDTLLAL